MRKLLPFCLLIPAVLLVALVVGVQFGLPIPYGTPAGLLAGAAAWVLLFLVVYGSQRGWNSVRVFLLIFVAGKFGAILYQQIYSGLRLDQLLFRLAGATVLAWFLFVMFWPRKRLENKVALD